MASSESAAFYQPKRSDVMQGDIFSFAPSACVKDEINLLKEFSFKGNRQIYARYALSFSQKAIDTSKDFGNTTQYAFDAAAPQIGTINYQFGRGLVLTHSCDVENEELRTIALIRSFLGVQDDASKETIRNNKNYNFFYLPEDQASGLPESYVDLRAVTTINKASLDECDRFLSLSDDSLKGLYAQIFLCITHSELDRGVLSAVDIVQ